MVLVRHPEHACFNRTVLDTGRRTGAASAAIGRDRKKRPRILAITTDCCTGCSGSPACIEYCPIEACMFWVPDEDHPPFGRIEVDPYLCIGCQKCTSKGPDGAFLDGCPWDAIEMVPTDDWEGVHGITLPDAPPAPPA